MSLGVLLYGGTGVLTWILGGDFLSYGVLAHDPAHGQHYGIIAVELGVSMLCDYCDDSNFLCIWFAAT